MAAPALLVLLVAWAAGAELRFANYYGDHMVLQKEPSHALLWGYGTPGASISVTIFQKQNALRKEATEVHASTGVWKVLLNPMAQGGPYNIEVRQSYEQEISNVTLEDVYFGDVWLCSGQSNMEMTVSQIFNASKELAEASHYPLVRIFSAALVESDEELEELGAIDLEWSIPTAKNLGYGDFRYFSAVCWLFGRYLFDALQYPIGLIDSTWGGTPIEAWSSKRALHECGISDTTRIPPSYRDSGPHGLSVLWNSMIHPFVNMTLQGVVWYQGEANTEMNTDLYNCTFPALIEDWRKAFHEGSRGQTQQYFPFGFVQLCTYRHVAPNDNFPHIRWHQTADYGYVPNKKMPNTFMAVTIDLGDDDSPYGSIHPRDKQTVAYRLHLGALAVAYGEKILVFQGPYPQTVHVDSGAGLINVTYNEPIVLHQLDSEIFEVCCTEEDVCKWSPAMIKSALNHSVFLYNTICPQTVIALRYAWIEWPCEYLLCPIYNRQNLPAPPFITAAKHNPAWTVS